MERHLVLILIVIFIVIPIGFALNQTKTIKSRIKMRISKYAFGGGLTALLDKLVAG